MISFIVPTRNEEKVIEKTLNALKKYTGTYEIVVSDANSPDKTVELAKKYTAQVIVDTSPKQTIAKGRNTGASAAKGDYLVFIDADVEIPDINTFMEKVITTFEEKPSVVAQTCFYRVFPEMETLADKINFKFLGYEFMLVDNFLHGGMTGGEIMIVRTDAFRKVGGFNGDLVASEDCELFGRLAKIGRVYFQKDLFVYHTGRRAHAIGWPKLWYQWTANSLGVMFFKKAVSKEWTAIR